MTMPLATGNGLGQFPSRRRHQPIVTRADEATAKRLGLSLDQLLQVAATLEQWGLHASGEPVYRFQELLRALGRLPEPRERASHRGGQVSRRAMRAAERR
jgi:hypothetical protein